MEGTEAEGRGLEAIEQELARLDILKSVLKCEGQRLLKAEYPVFVETYRLQQFDRLKRPGLVKMSAAEIRVYAALHGLTIRKATAIVRKFNAYISSMRLHREPAETAAWLARSGSSMN